MNMVRAGVVQHPSQWAHGGYCEIQSPPERYRLIDRERLIELAGMDDDGQLKRTHKAWIDEAVQGDDGRLMDWSEAVAVGSREFVEDMKGRLEYAVRGRQTEQKGEAHVLREPDAAYSVDFGGGMEGLRHENTVYFDINAGESIC